MMRVVLLASILWLAGCGAIEHRSWWQPTAETLRYQHHWQRLVANFISPDGRVIDLHSEREISTSEGQAYGMFLALVANDQTTFEKLLSWTQANLLPASSFNDPPAWLWGQRDDGSWGVLDTNPASDADIWMAYALLHAAEHWQQPRYAEYGRALANQVLREQTTESEHGLVLLPGPQGFRHAHGVTINPSYFSLPLFIDLAERLQDKRWLEIHQTATQLLQQLTVLGGVPDWIDVDTDLQPTQTQVFANADGELLGSYNAIRTYLWLQMEADRLDSSVAALNFRYDALLNRLQTLPAPETLVFELTSDASTLPQFERDAPIGFYAMYAHYVADSALKQALWQHLSEWPQAEYAERYYDTMLLLFGLGYQQCYRFTANGALQLNDAGGCHG